MSTTRTVISTSDAPLLNPPEGETQGKCAVLAASFEPSQVYLYSPLSESHSQRASNKHIQMKFDGNPLTLRHQTESKYPLQPHTHTHTHRRWRRKPWERAYIRDDLIPEWLNRGLAYYGSWWVQTLIIKHDRVWNTKWNGINVWDVLPRYNEKMNKWSSDFFSLYSYWTFRQRVIASTRCQC